MARRSRPVKVGPDQPRLRPRFWETVPLDRMTRPEWEALCDGCGKCCLNKLEDEETHQIAYTRLACRLFDDATCRCSQYPIRHNFVPECVTLSPANIHANAYWMPRTCAYRVLAEGGRLADWHPLISGDPNSVHTAGISVQGLTVPEYEVPDEDEWEDYLIDGEM